VITNDLNRLEPFDFFVIECSDYLHKSSERKKNKLPKDLELIKTFR
jgi:hypothetical protein